MNVSEKHPTTMRYQTQIPPAISLILLCVIVLISVLGNIYWIKNNIVLVGHDASNYLTNAIEYTHILTDLSPQTIFHAVTYPDYRTPLLYIAAQPFLHIFGADMDGAQYLNVTAMAIVIVLTYYLGAILANRGAGLFAALLVSLLPLMVAMARLFYTEMLLTIAVVASLIALYKSNNFLDRRWALVLGVGLGTGLLIKWTLPIYVGLPLLWSLWQVRSEISGQLRRAGDWRRWGLAILFAMGLAWLWYWPNQAQAELFPLGHYLWLGWLVILAPLCYVILSPSTRFTNVGAVIFLGLAIASLWYLPHSDFAAKLMTEDINRSTSGSSILSLNNYTRNFRHLYQSNFGTLSFWVIMPMALWPWFNVWRQHRTLNPNAIYLWLNIISTFIALSLILQQNPRNLVPILPSISILAAIALQTYRRPMHIVIGGMWVLALGMQLLLYTSDSMLGFYRASQALWSHQGYAIQPASQDTDPRYWVAPKVLSKIIEGGRSRQRLAMLVNTDQIHRGVFKYLIATDNLDIEIVDATEVESMGWYDILSATWVLVKDGDNHVVEQQGQSIIDRIFAKDALFNALYEVAETYELPQDETLYLYRRTKGPGFPHDLPIRLAETQVLAEWIKTSRQPDTPLVYASPNLAVWVGIHDPVKSPVFVLDPDKSDIPGQFPKISGTATIVLDQDSTELQDWLEREGYRGDGFGSETAWAITYGFAESLPDATTIQPQWNKIKLDALRTNKEVSPGMVLPVEIDTTGITTENLKLSFRMIAPDNRVIASHDRPLVAHDRFGLYVPPDSEPGRYALFAIVYSPENMLNIPAQDGSDVVMVGSVDVIAAGSQ